MYTESENLIPLQNLPVALRWIGTLSQKSNIVKKLREQRLLWRKVSKHHTAQRWCHFWQLRGELKKRVFRLKTYPQREAKGERNQSSWRCRIWFQSMSFQVGSLERHLQLLCPDKKWLEMPWTKVQALVRNGLGTGYTESHNHMYSTYSVPSWKDSRVESNPNVFKCICTANLPCLLK